MAKFYPHPPLDGLVDLACRDGVDIRPTLLRVLTDLYVQKPVHSAQEETQYVELALGLIDAVDAPTRAAVAASLSAYPAAPAAILGKLAGSAPGQHETPAATGPQPASRAELVELFFAASASDRAMILANLEAGDETAPRRPAPASSEVIRRLENAALRHNTGEFSRILERVLGVPRALADRIARDYSGEPIVVAAKALGMKAAVLHRILLVLNPVVGQSVERVFELARLYDELPPAAADRMVAIWRHSGGRPQAAHEPLLWDDERRDARSLSSPSRHRSEPGRDHRPDRLKTGEG
jgi:Uncharacterised protein conserved in bacteria (DUF2336)